jgi:glycosyltransferase involved in cell wall biosynthesis
MIGIKAIPAQSGGFETAVDEISRGLVRLGHDVVVYNRSGMSDYSFSEYEGVRLVTLPTLKSKNLSTIVHALLSTIHLIFHRVDVVHYFITGTTLFAPIPRLLGMKVVCSVDGTDWQRSKWGRFARWYLRFSERLAVLFCHRLVGDSRDVVRYYREVYGVSPSLITYGIRETTSEGLEWLERFALKPREYVLFVGRLVPENNIHQLIQAFERTTTDKKLAIVGHDPWEKEYVRSLKSTQDSRIIFTGGVYGIGYAQLQRNAYLFVLPDEVGGTHPALVEAMGFGNCVLVNDRPSNLEVIADAGFSYCGKEGFQDLRRQLQTLLDDRSTVEEFRLKAERRARANYNWEHVVGDHANLYVQLLTGTEVVDSNSVRVNVNTSATRDLTQIHREQEFVVGRKTATGSGPTLNEASK